MKNIFSTAFIILSLVWCLKVNAQIPTEDLKAYYPFSGDANDKSGNGNNGTVYGATLTTDRFGNANSAYDFDGSDDFIRVLDDPSIRVGKSEMPSFTISVWINISGWQSRSHVLTKRYNVYNAPYNSYGIHVSSEYLNYQTTPYWEASSFHGVIKATNHAEKSRWVHLVELYDGDSLYLFVDTKLQCKSKASGSVGYTNMDLLIGAAAGLPNQFMMGKIDDIRIYDRALTIRDIKSLFEESDNTAGIVTEVEPIDFQVYPNPIKDNLRIDFKENGTYVIKISDITGRIIYTTTTNSKNNLLDLSGCQAKGLGVIQVFKESGTTSAKTVLFSLE